MVARKITSPRPSPRVRATGPAWSDADVFIFDVEGTLVDAMMPTLRCWRETLEAFGHDISLAEIHSYAGMDADEMLAKLLPGASKNERRELIEKQGARFREDYLAHIPPLPGARALLQELKRNGRKVALATDCAKDQLTHYLDVTDVREFVDAIACDEDIRRGKPAPNVVDVALRKVRAGRRPAVMVGDTPFDAQAARKAGVIPVGVLTGHFSEAQLREASCRAVFRDLVAMRAALPRPVATEARELEPAAA
jgi:phosphoglycolate phosphatase-like HAD superfamily hydrolase